MSLFSKLFGDPNKRVIEKFQPLVDKINSLEPAVSALTDAQLKGKTTAFRVQLRDGATLDAILPEALAVVREAIRRTVKQRAFDVQLMAAMTLHEGKIAEQKTGEGKTLSAAMAAYLNALEGKGVHVVTVNDYLARRDAGWYGIALEMIGLSVSCITHEQGFIFDPAYLDNQLHDERLKHLRPIARKDAYAADVTYGTNNEFGFDYLRDNMVPSRDYMVQRNLHYAIVDEVDSILIDEARTPLIISAPAEESTDKYYQFAELVERLQEGTDFNIDEKMRASTLTEVGVSKMEKMLGIKNIYEAEGIETVHHIEQALRAKALFKKDRDYVVKEGEVIIVDEFTGRLMFGRRYSEGLHQAIEAKEKVDIKKESRTLATITFQNYFRLYKKLSGMTGTAATEAEELHKIYNLEVVIIPTNKPMVRDDKNDSIYKTASGKYNAIVREIKTRHELGQPILIGTVSIEKNELLGQLLEREGIRHAMLNAKNHEREADILADAGSPGAVTVATNMAGRGVDIVLGGVDGTKEDRDVVVKLGGLHVIGTERHESRRIDNQLRGRAGRQGDPGSSQFFVSTEDDLMRIFGSDKIKSMMDRLGVPDDMPIEHAIISKSIESAQKKVEGHNFDIRKHLVEYDDVINKHREVIYSKRKEILGVFDEKENDQEKSPIPLRKKIMELIEHEIDQIVSFHTSSEDEHAWNLDEIYEIVDTIFPIDLKNRIKLEEIRETAHDKKQDAEARTTIIKYLASLAQLQYDSLENAIGSPDMCRTIEKAVYLRAIDTLWIEHLDLMDHLRTGIGLRGYGQQDPLIEYKKEAFRLFNELMNNIQKNIVYTIFKVAIQKKVDDNPILSAPIQLSAPAKTSDDPEPSGYQHTSVGGRSSSIQKFSTPTINGTKQTAAGNIVTQAGKKVGRNDPCPCGSGKKFKKCHGTKL
ncbi:MAG: preprotein translocase subunit SecA [Patescibacteria group bacterium]|nr:preprotein translocase subunit SecA [Patescibacteria group bacterium]MDD5715095.1 preprotein translocase subunit SecA [Patescibacteria group bacterium]